MIAYNRLIERYLARTISEEEYLELKSWRAKDSMNEEYFQDYLKIENSKRMVSILEDTPNRWEKLEASLQGSNKYGWKGILSIAASVVVLFSVGLNIYWAMKKDTNELSPLCEFAVPAGGGLAHLTLSDGSQVTLNAGSKISYPSLFTSKQREVKLTGEAFFDISKDENRPFIVTLSDYQVEVLGTTFNIEAYEQMDYIKTTLFTGSILISPHKALDKQILLQPQESCIYTKRDEKYNVRKEDFLFEGSWRSGNYKFKDTSLQEICLKLEQIYGVKISLAPYIQEDLYTGTIAFNKPIEVALQLLNYKQEFTIEKTNDNLYKIK